LETDPVAQSRALNFYRQIGFYEIEGYSGRTDEIAMEMILVSIRKIIEKGDET
jgi:hypothetical protein